MSIPQGKERRRLKRYLQRIPARFESEGMEGRGHIKNISKEGIFLRVDRLPRAGDSVRVILEPESGPKIEVEGIVRWTTAQLPDSSEAPPGFGLRLEGDLREFHTLFEHTLLN